LNGKPSQLLAQSNQVTTVANKWVTGSLTASIVAGQYYWLTVTSNAQVVYYYDYAAGASLVYSTEPTITMSTNYGASTVWAAAKTSVYATYTTTALEPAPSPSATPAPTPTLAPTPTTTPAVPSITWLRGLNWAWR